MVQESTNKNDLWRIPKLSGDFIFWLKDNIYKKFRRKQIVDEVIHKKVIDLKYAEYFVGRNPNRPLVLKLM